MIAYETIKMFEDTVFDHNKNNETYQRLFEIKTRKNTQKDQSILKENLLALSKNHDYYQQTIVVTQQP